MKSRKLLFALLGLSLLASSCYTEVIFEDDFIVASPVNTDLVLQSYDLWYVDINASDGRAEIPFLQQAFTVSFNRGVVYANNNIVGIGKTGNGLGIDVGSYSTYNGAVAIDHVIDGLWDFEIYIIDDGTIELYSPRLNTRYVLRGYQRGNFDYDRLFYENIHLLLEEYTVWEKSFTSDNGAVNEFDNENFLQFGTTNGGYFKSSVDPVGTPLQNIQWDYEGDFEVYDVVNDETLKTLTLDYDFMGNDYFELYVINDGTIELYHVATETVYEFRGLGLNSILKTENVSGKKRVKTNNKVMHVSRKRKK
ncbi:MAG: nicotinic acid mononucleotide adenyltransferase [Croceitalea sp.]|nr:nicotinic acid mononucleotide adenyltransferase [Croceitalea sp.]